MADSLLNRSGGINVLAEVTLLLPSESDRAQAIRTGYRPLCLIEGEDPVSIGMCETRIDEECIPAGGTGIVDLFFDESVASVVRARLPVGTRFALAEGLEKIGYATVKAVS